MTPEGRSWPSPPGLGTLGREDKIVVCGGVIPAQDYDFLLTHGAAAIFGPGSKLPEAATLMMEKLLQV